MYQKILVAIDISDMRQKVVREAISLSQVKQTQIMLLHVLSTEEENSPLPIPVNLTDLYPAAGNELTLEAWRAEWEKFERQGWIILEHHAQETQSAGIATEYKQISGSPGRIICKLAREWQADLIVMGHRGRSGLPELLLGSVSNYVLHHAPCSVMIAQTPG